MKRSEVFFLSVEIVEDIHQEALDAAGGSAGVRDRGLLESATFGPANSAFYYGSLADLAAGYAYGLAKNHAFVDGNKRTAFYAMVEFLGLNGFRVQLVNKRHWIQIFEGLAAGTVSRDDLTDEIATEIGALQAAGKVFVDFDPEADEE